MHEVLTLLLQIQDLDLKIIRLLKLHKKHNERLSEISAVTKALNEHVANKRKQIEATDKAVNEHEALDQELQEKIKRYEKESSDSNNPETIRKLASSIVALKRDQLNVQEELSKLIDTQNDEKETLAQEESELAKKVENSRQVVEEIQQEISVIEKKKESLVNERQAPAEEVKGKDPETYAKYVNLMKNKGAHVIVPVHNNTCGACHIAVTKQHVNILRTTSATSKINYCEHCGVMHYVRTEEGGASAGRTGKVRRRVKAQT